MKFNVKPYNYLICTGLLLSACTPGPGYLLKRDAKKDNGSHICNYEAEYPYPRNTDMYFAISEFGTQEDAQKACIKAQKLTKNKYRCSDYLGKEYSLSYDGTAWGGRMYDKCIADNGDNCYSQSYSFAHCIAAKCNYKSKSLPFKENSQKNHDYDVWITKSEWDECWYRNY